MLRPQPIRSAKRPAVPAGGACGARPCAHAPARPNLDCPSHDAPASIVIPTRARPAYLRGGARLDRPAGRRRAAQSAGRRRRRPVSRRCASWRAASAPATSRTTRPARAQRRPQHRRRTLRRRPGGVRRRRHPRAARDGCDGAARSAAREPRTSMCSPARSAARLEGAAPARPAGARAADHDARPRPARHRRALRLGRQHGDPAQRARAGRRPFDVSLADGGDEQEWQERLRAREPGARVLYVAGGGASSTAAPATTRTLRSLARAAYARGRAARRFDARRGARADARRELRSRSAGCLGHVLRRRCPAGLMMVAHSAGRLRERSELGQPVSTDARPPAQQDGRSRAPRTSCRARAARSAGSTRCVAEQRRRGRRRARAAQRRARCGCARAARSSPPTPARARARRRAPAAPRVSRSAIRAELQRSRHRSSSTRARPASAASSRTSTALLDSPSRRAATTGCCVIDDDVELPRGFLDRFLFLCERFSLDLAQPAHRLHSHAAWPVDAAARGQVVRRDAVRRDRPASPRSRAAPSLCCCRSRQLRMGWGLDVHWAALAREHGWRCGVLDAGLDPPPRRARPRPPTRARRRSRRRARSSPAAPTCSADRGEAHPHDPPTAGDAQRHGAGTRPRTGRDRRRVLPEPARPRARHLGAPPGARRARRRRGGARPRPAPAGPAARGAHGRAAAPLPRAGSPSCASRASRRATASPSPTCPIVSPPRERPTRAGERGRRRRSRSR